LIVVFWIGVGVLATIAAGWWEGSWMSWDETRARRGEKRDKR
jgi:hypothetical protein